MNMDASPGSRQGYPTTLIHRQLNGKNGGQPADKIKL
jgi:hypothetical protein